MEHYLRSCKAALQNKDVNDFHVVLGNEACDLDSMVSAIALAYFLSKASSSKNLVHIPVLNIAREDFPLRTECSSFLRENGISEDLLTFRDEVDLTELYEAGQLSLSLVDHNVLPRSDAFMEDVVTQVIDHHALERKACAGCLVTVEPVGSCATLITEKIVREAPQILDAQLSALLRGTIVLDCVNMAPAAGKVTPKDTEYVALLESKFPDLPPRGSIFDWLQNSKFDVSGLSTHQMLRKDLKALTSRDVSLAVSAIYMHIEEFLRRDGLERDLQAFCQKYGYNVLVAMAITFTAEKEPIRQIAVYSQRGALRDLVSRALEQATSPSLDLSPAERGPCQYVTVFHQGNAVASRKKVLPILKDLLRKSDSSSRPMQASQEAEGSNGQLGFHERLGDNHYEAAEFPLDEGEQPDSQDELKGNKGYRARFRKQTEDGLDDERSFPPTPMNSLVEGCPLDRGLPKLTAEAILERISLITTVDSEGNATTGSQ